ncbi:hypothetical protein JHK85_022482 [Glycine max]|nr:hypothetical protein JHK85_022482 [Glycine max]
MESATYCCPSDVPFFMFSRVTRAIMEFVACANPDNNDEISDSETQPNKWMRKKSMVWDYFTVETVGAGCTRAYCKQCKKSFSYITDSKLTGTSHLKRHISLGICRVLREKNQQRSYPKTGGSLDTANPLKKGPRATPGFAGNGISFYQEHCNHDVAKMIILHDYPLHIVKQQGFIDFVWMLQPQFNPFCLNSVEADCVAMHLRKNEAVMGNLRGLLFVKNPAILNSQLLNQNGYARALSHFAADALLATRETISKVRKTVMHVKSSESHKRKFIELKQHLQVPSMVDLSIDDQYKWNTTYHILVAACELKEVFTCLDTIYPDYRMTLTMGDSKILTVQPCPTSNLFLAEVSKVQVELTYAAFSQDPFLSSLFLPLHNNFDQY